MTLEDSITSFAKLSVEKTRFLARNPLGFWVASMMAGAYVGMGILLIFAVGQNADPSSRSLVMGVSFGIALTLVVFAGSELFTGHTMYMTIGLLTGNIRSLDMLRAWGITWVGNLTGSALLGILFVLGGGGAVLQEGGQDLIHAVATKKMSAPAVELFFRAMLCNWLVCLAIWGAARTTNDTAKCIIIFWCLFAFIAAGFEHSVVNMTLFSVAWRISRTVPPICEPAEMVRSARRRISVATTVNPVPASPALFASIDAFIDNNVVWSATV